MKNFRNLMLTCLALFALLSTWSTRAVAADPVLMSVQFNVADYATWRPVFDGAESLRSEAKIKNPRVFRNSDKPNEILVVFDVPSKEAGLQWIRSSALRQAWKNGGVTNDPIVGFLSLEQFDKVRQN